MRFNFLKNFMGIKDQEKNLNSYVGRPRIAEEVIDEMRGMRILGVPVLKIAKEVGVSKNTVIKYTKDIAVKDKEDVE